MKRAPYVVMVSAFGYFVDVLDLFLFNAVRQKSLIDLGINAADSLNVGMRLLNIQMIGLLLGAFVFGCLGDRLGRSRALCGSILVYSAGTFLNGWVDSVFAYGLCRFISGFGLAGELGAAITMVSETLPQKTRGLGTTLVASFGLGGGVCAAVLAESVSWRTCYLVGGLAGFGLLFFRLSASETALFRVSERRPEPKGSLRLLFRNSLSARRFVRPLFIGAPVWFVAGIVIAFSPELGAALGTPSIVAARAVLVSYLGVALGDVGCGLLSQRLQSRRRAMLLFLCVLPLVLWFLTTTRGPNPSAFYWLCFFLGVSTGYWAVLLTTAAEQFGTNLRATVATTTPNLVRAATIPLTLLFRWLQPIFGTVATVQILGFGTVALALLGLRALPETFHRSLDFFETGSHIDPTSPASKFGPGSAKTGSRPCNL